MIILLFWSNFLFVDAYVGRVEVVDYDAGVNKEFDLTIFQQIPGPPVPLKFYLNGLDLYTSDKLDREEIGEYQLVMRAADRGDPSRIGNGTLTITVLDINDNAPFFNETFSFTLNERQTTGLCFCFRVHPFFVAFQTQFHHLWR